MTFNELRESAEITNLLAMQKRKSLEKEISKLNTELDKYRKIFLISEKTFQEEMAKHFDSLGMVAKFTVETSPAKGKSSQENYITKNYVISLFNKNNSSSIKPDKRYVWLSRVVPKENLKSAKADLSFDLYSSPVKTSMFNETPGIREVYWRMVKGNCKELYKQQAPSFKSPKTGKLVYKSFNPNKTDLGFIEKETEKEIKAPSEKVLG